MAAGDCFTVALAMAEDHADEDVRVVHGTPIGTGPENMGERYYTLDEAQEHMDRTGHYGPWENVEAL